MTSRWSTVGKARRQTGGDGIRIEITLGPLKGAYWITKKGVGLLVDGRTASFGTINTSNGIFSTSGEVRLSNSGKMLLFYPDRIGLASRTGVRVVRKRDPGDGAEWQVPARDMLAHYGRRDPDWVAVMATPDVLVRWGVQAPLPAPEASAA